MGPQDHTHLPMIVVLLIIRKHLREKNRYSLLLLGSRTEQENVTFLVKLGMVYKPHLLHMSTINLLYAFLIKYIYIYTYVYLFIHLFLYLFKKK